MSTLIDKENAIQLWSSILALNVEINNEKFIAFKASFLNATGWDPVWEEESQTWCLQ